MNQASPALLILGSYHMNNPGRDAYNLQADDVLAPKRQVEILEVVARLGRFRPTQVAIECSWRVGDDWQRDYAAFRGGVRAHPRRAPPNWVSGGGSCRGRARHRGGLGLGRPAGDRLRRRQCQPGEFMAAHQPALHQHIDQEGRRQIAEMQRILDAGTVRDLLHWLNTEEQEVANHRVYLGAVALAGDATDPVGVAWLAEWYRRNLTIFANLVRLAGSPGDRVLAIYGAGHVPLLRQFAQQSGLFHVVDAIAYL